MRFAFGKNWRSFLSLLDDQRVDQSRRAICELLGRNDLQGLRVLDIGSGSGLSSLAMHQLGAEVVAFDYDPDSVACTEELRRLYGPGGKHWTVMQGSVLDAPFMQSLGEFDLVYSWGVLHHTGEMWKAIDLAQKCVAPGGTLLIALYNDQGWRSRVWHTVKRFYCSSQFGRGMVVAIFYPLFATYALWQDVRHLHMPGAHARDYVRKRGMSLSHDWRDWLGGFPFEVAKPEDVVQELAEVGFELQRQTLTRGLGCNEFVFTKGATPHGK
ncbi:class I SAM-dependent methyltransferase [Dyella solisilvae]|uniref:Class I SAM-dependent methyltransferase n=1 Tax=Dyella solisilvae TaxID=1920168 RepID=A0A370KC02_9GAMM|nr:class I SAM-dependent methyltransferase [Dyella solisilvae]RDJ00177.1 class I SAM-dependent methyltransferase [Dyella solisilvae]